MEHKLLITKDKSNTIYSYNFDDIYHSKHGAINEAHHVFIKNGLLSDTKNKDLPKILFSEDHLSHAASAFYPSPFSQSSSELSLFFTRFQDTPPS